MVPSTRFVGQIKGVLLSVLPLIFVQQSADSAPSERAKVFSGKTSNIQIDPAYASRFDIAFDSICNQAHVLVISEGIPMYRQLSKEQLLDLIQKHKTANEDSVSAVIVQLANAYDYDVEQADATTFLLRKRYSDPADLPCVTYSEIVNALQSILQVVDAYSPVVAPGEVLSEERLYDSLTAEQQKLAEKGLQLSDLNEEQRHLALLALEHSVLEPRIESVRRAARLLLSLKRNDAVFRWMSARRKDQSETTAFGYRGKFGKNGELVDRPLTAPFKSAGDGPYTWITVQMPAPTLLSPPVNLAGRLDVQRAIPSSILSNQASSPAAKGTFQSLDEIFSQDPTAPSSEDRLVAPLGLFAHRLPSTVTMQEAGSRAAYIVDGGTSNFDRGFPQSLNVAVDKAIAEKPVNVFGIQYAVSPRHYLSALCRLYGLQLLVGEHQHYNIVLPRPRSTETRRDVPAEIARVTPLPLIDALSRQSATMMQDLQDKQNAPTPNSDGAGLLSASQSARDKRQTDRAAASKLSDALYFSAVRRLLALAEPLVPDMASPPVTVSALAPESVRLVALTVLTGDCLAEISYLQKYIPPESIANLDKLWIMMTRVPTGGAPLVTAAFGRRLADGTFKYDAITRSMTLPAGVSSNPGSKVP